MMTLSDHQGHSLIDSLFKCEFLYSSASVKKITIDIATCLVWIRHRKKE